MSPRFLKNATRMARPTAASAAATVSTITEELREGDKVDVDGEQHQLDRHQNDDDVLAIDENARHADGEEDRRDAEIVSEPDHRG